MKKLDSQESCPCGSGRIGAGCCLVEAAPVTGVAIGFDDFRFSMQGISVLGNLGFPTPIPAKLTLTTTLNNPHQIDADVEKMMELLSTTFTSVQRSLARERQDELWSNLKDALEATRYHQRQYIFRHRLLHEKASESRMRGSPQIEVIFNDVPLNAELQAVLVRSRAALDTLGDIALTCLGQKGEKFGGLWTFVKTDRATKVPQGKVLRRVFAEHNRWLEDGKRLRDCIAHGRKVQEFRGMKAAVSGVDPARLIKDDAAGYTISLWRRLIGFVDEILRVLSGHEGQR
jgi:hypothetical protein